MNDLYIKPNKDTRVRNPERNNEHVPAYGAKVARSSYWVRRLRDEDVTEIKQADFEKAQAAHLKKQQDDAKNKAAEEKKAAEQKNTDNNSEAS